MSQRTSDSKISFSSLNIARSHSRVSRSPAPAATRASNRSRPSPSRNVISPSIHFSPFPNSASGHIGLLKPVLSTKYVSRHRESDQDRQCPAISKERPEG